MLNELIKEKINKYIEKEYNIFILISGSLISAAVILAGFSIFISPILSLFSITIYIIYLFLLDLLNKKIYKKIKNIIDNALQISESRQYLGELYDEYGGGLGYLRALEEEPEILGDLEEMEARKIRASKSLYKALVQSARSRMRTTTLMGTLSGFALSIIINNLFIKIIYILLLIIGILILVKYY